MVNVSYGEHNRQIELAGRTVADVREMFKSEFDLSDRAQANLNGQSLKKKLYWTKKLKLKRKQRIY